MSGQERPGKHIHAVDGQSIVLRPVESAARQLVQLSLHYLVNQPSRISLADRDTPLPDAAAIGASPRMVAFVDVPPGARFLPQTAGLNDGRVVTFFSPLIEKLKQDGGTQPGAYPRMDCGGGEGEGAAGPFGLGVAVGADRPPHGDVRREGRPGVRVAVQVDVRPAQRPGLLGADPGEQAQDDVGVHQLGRAADILQPGMQFHDRQGPGCGDDRHGLVQGQGPGRAAFLAFGGVGQDRDVAGDEVVCFGVPDGPLERQVPHGHCGGRVPGRHRGQCLAHVVRGQFPEFAAADDGQDRLEDVLVLGDGLGGAALQPVGEPVGGGLPDGVVGVARLGGDPFVEMDGDSPAKTASDTARLRCREDGFGFLAAEAVTS